MPIRALKIPANDEVPIRAVYIARPGSPDEYQQHVGGSIEYIELHEPRMSLVVDEAGEVTRRPPNRRASVLYWQYRPEMTGTPIYGDAVLVGPPDPDGYDTDLPYAYNPWSPAAGKREDK